MSVVFLGLHNQGVYTAARILTEIAFEKGNYVQFVPLHFLDRRSEPVWAFATISPRPVRIHELNDSADHLVVMHESILKLVDTDRMINDMGVMYLNCKKSRNDIIKEYELEKRPDYILDAAEIARQEAGDVYPNLPVLGCVLSRMGFLQNEDDRNITRRLLEKYFLPERIDSKMRLLDIRNYMDQVDTEQSDDI